MARSTDPNMLHFSDEPEGRDDDELDDDQTIAGIDDPEEEIDPQERRRRERGDYVDRDPEDDDEDEEPEPEEEEEEETEAVAPRRRGNSDSVPIGRFKEVVKQRNELIEAMRGLPEALVAAARSGATPPPAKKEEEPPAYPMAAKLREHSKLLLDGEEEKAAELMVEILAENGKAVARSVELTTTERVLRQTRAEREAADVEDVLARAFDKHPHIAGETPKAKEAQDEIIMYRNHYMATKGMPMSKALEKAIERVAPLYAPKSKKDRDDDRGGEDLLAAARRRAAEKRAAETSPQRNIDRIRRNVAASNAQPPSIARTGSSGKPRSGASQATARQIAEMSDEEYAMLSDADKRKLRGDDVKA